MVALRRNVEDRGTGKRPRSVLGEGREPVDERRDQGAVIRFGPARGERAGDGGRRIAELRAEAPDDELLDLAGERSVVQAASWGLKAAASVSAATLIVAVAGLKRPK